MRTSPAFILVTNDDGIDAPGINALIEAVTPLGDICVFAPKTNQSASSSSLNIRTPIIVNRIADNRYCVEGSTTDCVHIALSANGLLPRMPDLVVSGINDGANMGDDTIYSGTLAGAIEGHLFGIPAIAFSLSQNPAHNFNTAARIARHICAKMLDIPQQSYNYLLNINIPDLAFEDLKNPAVITRLGRRHKAQQAIWQQITDNKLEVQIGEAGTVNDGMVGTDFHAVANQQVSITPITCDLTAFHRLSEFLQMKLASDLITLR